MKVTSCIVLLVAAAVASGNDKPHYDVKDAPELFDKFVKEYNRHYKSASDMMEHYEAFVKTLYQINASNDESGNAIFDINQFSDYTAEELEKMRGLRPH